MRPYDKETTGNCGPCNASCWPSNNIAVICQTRLRHHLDMPEHLSIERQTAA